MGCLDPFQGLIYYLHNSKTCSMQKFSILASLCTLACWFVPYLVRNSKYFYHVAHYITACSVLSHYSAIKWADYMPIFGLSIHWVREQVYIDAGKTIQMCKLACVFAARIYMREVLFICLLRSAMAGCLYKLQSKHPPNSGLTKTLCRAQAIFYSLPNNEWGTAIMD